MQVKHFHFFLISACLLAPSSLSFLSVLSSQLEIDIGSRLELLLDEYLIDSRKNLSFELHSPVPKEVVMTFNLPWEGPLSDYITVFQDAGRFRMYYATKPHGNRRGVPVYTCYAESQDGIIWEKPSLGLVEFEGSTENNIVWTSERGKAATNFTAFLDTRPGVPADQRYKALGGAGDNWGLQALASEDGIHWRLLRENPVVTGGKFDSQNLAFWDERQRQYVCYYRIKPGGVRAIARATSPDFIQWSPGEPIDLGDAPTEHLYTNTVLPYFRAPHYYLSFPLRFVPGREPLVPIVMRADGVNDGPLCSAATACDSRAT